MSKYLIGTAIILCLLIGVFFGGYKYYPLRHPPPAPTIDTIMVYDTVTHLIRDTVPYYIVRRDSIVKWRETLAKIDTAAILADYFAIHYFTRYWEDSLLFAQSDDAVSENKFVDNYFTYKIKRPQQIISNDYSVNYSKYLYGAVGLSTMGTKYTDISVYFASKQLLLGAGYEPFAKNLRASVGFKIAKFKK